MPVSGAGVGDPDVGVAVTCEPGVGVAGTVVVVGAGADRGVRSAPAGCGPSGIATADEHSDGDDHAEGDTRCSREAQSVLPPTAYYTACGMAEYTERSPDAARTDQGHGDPVPRPAQPVANGPRASSAGSRRLIGPFTARQIGLINAVVVGTALILLVVTRPITDESTSQTVPGASFYRIAAETQGLQVGQRAPDFVGQNGDQEVRLTDLDGQEIRLADLAGHPVWVVFWATWCPPCQQETPDIRAAFEANRDAGLVVVAVDVQEPTDTVRQYAERYGLTYRIGIDTYAAIMKTYGVFGLPTHYFIDRQGVIRDRYFGPLKRDQMDQRIDLISQP